MKIDERAKIYCARYECDRWYIIALNFGDAIEQWHKLAAERWEEDYEPTDEPDSMELLDCDAIAVTQLAEIPIGDPTP